jgi:glycosyltransferase involved in cell wall biosynthesis
MKSIPHVSVVIPTYNNVRYLQPALDSVFQQTYPDLEIIVVDDGSTDETPNLLESYANRLRYISQENQGSAAARNRGIQAANGKLIAFLDSDDYFLLPDKIAQQVACFQANPALGSVQTGWKIVNQLGETIRLVEPWHKIPELTLEAWIRWKPVRTSALMVRRHWLERAGGFDANLRQSHDVDLALRLAAMGCTATWLRQITCCYRQHDTNTTGHGPRQAKYVQAVLDKFFSRPDLPAHIRQLEPEVRYSTLVWIAWYQYYTGTPAEMTRYLQKSLAYTPNFPTETISNWLEHFHKFSTERGHNLNLQTLTASPEWQQATYTALAGHYASCSPG